MRKATLTLIAGAAAIAFSSAAQAQTRQAPQADLTRAQAEQQAAQLFDRLDVNNDGRLDAADREARRQARFDRLDANNDGTISREEYAAARAERGQRGNRSGERMGKRGMGGMAMGMRGPGRQAGADANRVVTRAEFAAAALTRFEAADAKNGGVVTAAERKAHRDTMRQQWRERRGQNTN
jgi:hypothetical protein